MRPKETGSSTRSSSTGRLAPDPARIARGEISPNYAGGIAVRDLNPPFDRRMQTIGRTPTAKKGKLVHAQAVNGVRSVVNFMFNPSVLGVDYSFQLVQDQQSNPLPGVGPDVPGQGAISLELLFDRTYEITYGPPGSLAKNYGVHIDVLAFYAFFGMIERINTINRSWEDLYPRTSFQAQPAYLYVSRLLKFYGWCDGLSVKYTHFAQDMTPVRAAIGLHFNVIVGQDPNATSSGISPDPPATESEKPKKDHSPQDYLPFQ